MTVDQAFESARQVIETAADHLEQIKTEEDAKLQIITRILTEALGWNHTEISAEQPNENGYSDYVVSRDGQASFVLEAKRVICPPLSGPETMIVWTTKGTLNAKQEAQAGRDHRQAA